MSMLTTSLGTKMPLSPFCWGILPCPANVMLCWHTPIPYIWTGTNSYFEILFFNYYIVFGLSLRWAVSRQRTLHGLLETRESGSCGHTPPSEQPEFSSAGHLLPLLCQSGAAWVTCSLPSAKGTTSSKSRARWGQENLIWPAPCWLSYFLVLALQQLLPEDSYWDVTIT